MTSRDLSVSDYQALAGLRFQIRCFLRFSETAARAEGLEPQQHQLLLAIRAMDQQGGPTIGHLADHLLIQHHSAVGLIDRLASHGLVERARSEADRRQVRIRLTVEGEEKLRRLTAEHRSELRNSGPLLVATLGALLEGLSKTEEGNVSETEDCRA
ncbi:MAG TPA: MarR family transcriptional regulator [Bryobacteraceae bacterium]|nr:MarR family transcriptional regulator [Bryobacteraceae bacterium]